MSKRKKDYSKEFEKYWNDCGCYLPIDNPTRTRNSIIKWLETCEEVSDIDEHVCKLKARRETIRKTMVDFFDYINEATLLSDKRFYDYPLERQIEIAKYLHIPRSNEDIEKEFDISEETRKKDLQALRNGIEFMGATIKIEEERKGRKKFYRSTMHPVFLPLNLTEVYALTSYLPRQLDCTSANKGVIDNLARRIKSQLSDYAYDKLFPGERHAESSNDYINDEEYANRRTNTLMYLSKTGERCRFIWRSNEYYGRVKYSGEKHIIQLDDGSILDADVEKLGEIEFFILEYK